MQALVDQREEEYKERQWALAEAQQGLVAAGSQETVETFVAEAQKVAHMITNTALEEQLSQAQEEMKKAEEEMRAVQTRQQSIADGVKGKKRAAGVAPEREGKSGKPTKKGQHLFPQKNPRRGMAIGWH